MIRKALLLFSLLFAFNVASQDTFVFSSIEGPIVVGLGELIIEDAYGRLGKKVEIVKVPAARGVAMANAGEFDGELGRVLGMLDDYENLHPVPIALYEISLAAFARNNSISINGWQSLQPYRVGIMRGILSAEKNTQGLNRYMATTSEQLFRMLDVGRLDVAVTMKVLGEIEVRRMGIQDVYALEPVLSRHAIHHFVHSKHQHLIPQLSRVFEDMWASGHIATLTDRFAEKIMGELQRR